MTDLQPGQAVLVDWSEAQYHGDTSATSRSQLEDLRASPALFYARHEARLMPPEPPSPSMVMGTHIHTCVLEPEEWERRKYPTAPERPEKANGRAKRDSDEYRAFAAWRSDVAEWERGRAPDSIILDDPERAKIEAIAASIRSHKYISMLLDGDGHNEQTVLWRHEETGLLVRLRIDRLRHIDDATKVVLDLKSTNNPTPMSFAASCARYGYHRQGAIYTDAVRALYPDADVHYVLAVVRTSPPYETAVYELDDALELGRVQYTRTMHDLVRRRKESDWLAPWQHGCQTLNLPAWAYMETE